MRFVWLVDETWLRSWRYPNICKATVTCRNLYATDAIWECSTSTSFWYPLVNVYITMERSIKITMLLVGESTINGSFSSSQTVNVYQRVFPIKSHQIPLNHHFPMVFLWFSYMMVYGLLTGSQPPHLQTSDVTLRLLMKSLQQKANNFQLHRMGPPSEGVQLPKKSGWILWFMVDIPIVNGC